MKQGFVYIMTNRPNGVLYIGVTANLLKRDYEHKTRAHKGFTQRYNLDKLVYYEVFDNIKDAIHREKQLKKYLRFQKIALIQTMNPNWNDLAFPFTA